MRNSAAQLLLLGQAVRQLRSALTQTLRGNALLLGTGATSGELDNIGYYQQRAGLIVLTMNVVLSARPLMIILFFSFIFEIIYF